MGIKIKQNRMKWRIEIDNEEWEFEDRKEMEANLKILLDMKERKGDISKY